MSRYHPSGYVSRGGVNCRIDHQLGVLVSCGGFRSSSLIYSPVSGYTTIPIITGDLKSPVIDYTDVLPDRDSTSVDYSRLRIGSSIKYAAEYSALKGVWVAVDIEIVDCPIKNEAPFHVRAIVHRVDPFGLEKRMWLWNDNIGRIAVPDANFVLLEPFDEVDCLVDYAGESWNQDGEDIPWVARSLTFVKPKSYDSDIAKKLHTSDGWELATGLSAFKHTVLVHKDTKTRAYASIVDFAVSYNKPRPIVGDICQVTYVEQIGAGVPFKRAVFVSPSGSDPISPPSITDASTAIVEV